jgi:hypothetical protein
MSYLFSDQKFSDYFESIIINSIVKDVEELPENQFLASSNEEIISYIFSKHEIIPLQIFEDSINSQSNDIKIQYRGEIREYDGVKFSVELPFTGDSKLWHLRPSTCVGNFPDGCIICNCNRDGFGILAFDITVAIDQDINTSNKLVEDNLKYIKSFIDYQKKDIDRYNSQIKTVTKSRIDIRRERLKKKEAVIKAFKIPLRRYNDAPDVINIPIKRKLVKPLPLIPNKPSEYGSILSHF